MFWSAFGLMALVVLAMTWLWTVDLGMFKPQLERWVSEETGREFAIDGAFTVDLSRHTVVIANDVRFQNAAWADDPQMLEIGRAEVRLDLWSLFKGPIHVELIDVDDAVIRLAQPEDNDANWDLSTEEAIANGEEESDAGMQVLFELIDIDRVHVVYDSFDRDKALDLRIEYLNQRHREDDFLDLELQATLGGSEIYLDGEAGTLQALMAGKDIHYSFESQLDTFEIEGGGWIDDIASLQRPSVHFSAKGPDVDDLTRMLGVGERGEGDVNISGALTPVVDGPLVLNVKGNVGGTNIEATGAISDLQNLEQVDIDLLASGPDLNRILRIFDIHGVREAPFMIDVDAERRGTMLVVEQGRMVFAGAEFDVSARVPNFPSVDHASIAVQVDGPDLERFRDVTRLPGMATGAFSVGFELADDSSGKEAIKLDLTTSLGQVNASGQLGDAPDYIGSTFDFQAKGDSLALLGDAYGILNLPDKIFNVQGSAQLVADGIRFTGPLTGNVEGISVSLEGLIAFTSGITGSDLSFAVAGPSLAALTGAFGVSDGIPDEPYDFNGELNIRENAYLIQNVSGTLGSSTVNIDALLVPESGLAGSRVSFEVSGPAFEEIIDEIGDLEVRPGSYELSGKIVLQANMIEFDDIRLDREAGDASMNMELGLPISRHWADFDIRADGSDVRSVLGGIEGYEAEEAPFFVDARGELREANLSFDKFEVGIGDARMQARGDINFGDNGSSTRFSYQGNIPSLAQLGSYDERRLRDQGITWNANFTGDDRVLAIEDLNVTLGESDVNGSIRFTKGDVPKLDIDIQSDSIVFGPLLEEQEFEYEPEPVFADGRLIPDIAVPFDAMKLLNATVSVDIRELVRDSLHMRNVDLAIELQDGVLNVQNASFDAHSGWIKARGKVEPADGTGRVSLELVARNFGPRIWMQDPDDAMTGDIDVKLDSNGVDTRTLAGSATGMILVDIRGGRLANSQTLQAIYGDMLTEILNVINPFYKADPYTDITCVVLALNLDDGRVTSAPVSFVGTDKIRLSLKSAIDLKSEAIDMGIKMTPQQGLKISSGEILNPFVKVIGTLAAPGLAVDETGVLVSGGVAVATGGLSVLAGMAWDRLSRSKDPCRDAAIQGKEALADRFPDLGKGLAQ